MTKFAVRRLDHRALKPFFDRIQLATAWMRVTLHKVDLTKGFVHVYLPEEVSIDRGYLFDLAGIIPSEKHEEPIQEVSQVSLRYTANKVYNLLQASDGSIAIFEEPIGLPTDEWFIRHQPPSTMVINNAIYYFSDRQSTLKDVFQSMTNADYAYPSLLGIVISLYGDEHPIERELIEHKVGQISLIVVGAYDGEAQLIWTPN